MLLGRRLAAVVLLTVVLTAGVLAVPARADTYTNYLVGQLRADPVYISSYSPLATPGDAAEIQRLLARVPLKSYVVADVAAGPDGQLQDSDLAAILHDELGGGLYIIATDAEDGATATGFGTSLPVSDAMTAASLELGSQVNVSLVALVQRFVSILLSGQTEQQLSAVVKAGQQTPGQAPTGTVLGALGGGAALSGGLSVILVTRRRRRRRLRSDVIQEMLG